MRRFNTLAFSAILFYIIAVSIQALAQHPEQGKYSPLLNELEIDFVEVPVYGAILTNDSVFADVINHSKTTPFSGESRSTNAHETAHGIHNVLRNEYSAVLKRKVNGFYILQGRGVIVEEPKIKKSHINYFIPANLRSYRWKNYFEESKDWEDRPLYILDEFSAYIIGAKVGIDDVKNKRHTDKWHDGVSGCLEFSIYTIGLCIAVQNGDVEYWDNNIQFRNFVNMQLHEANVSFIEGCKMEEFKSKRQDLLLHELLYSEEADHYRHMLHKYFNDAWLNEATTTTSVIDTTYKVHQK